VTQEGQQQQWLRGCKRRAMAAKEHKRGRQWWQKDTREASNGGNRRHKRDVKTKMGNGSNREGVREHHNQQRGHLPMDYINI
jgi:hypothetical protein